MSDVSQLLDAAAAGDRKAAAELLPIVYDELRKLAAARAARERPGDTLQPTAIVHEAYLRLIGGQRSTAGGTSSPPRPRPCAVSSSTAPATSTPPRQGGGRQRVDLDNLDPAAAEPDPELLLLDDALGEVERRHPCKAEVVKLRFFAGLSVPQVADALGVSVSTAENDWAYARSWLRLRMGGAGDTPA